MDQDPTTVGRVGLHPVVQLFDVFLAQEGSPVRTAWNTT